MGDISFPVSKGVVCERSVVDVSQGGSVLSLYLHFCRLSLLLFFSLSFSLSLFVLSLSLSLFLGRAGGTMAFTVSARLRREGAVVDISQGRLRLFSLSQSVRVLFVK